MAKKVRIAQPTREAPIDPTKENLIAGMVGARKDILDAVAGFNPKQQNQVFLGEWSIKELLAHLTGWDRTYIAAVQDLQAGESPSFYAAYDEDWQTYNLNLVREYMKDDWSELISEVKESHKQLVDYLQTLTEEDLTKDWGVRYDGTPVTVARLIEAEIKDEREHLRQIKKMMR
jgi:hypothetical protein